MEISRRSNGRESAQTGVRFTDPRMGDLGWGMYVADLYLLYLLRGFWARKSSLGERRNAGISRQIVMGPEDTGVVLGHNSNNCHCSCSRHSLNSLGDQNLSYVALLPLGLLDLGINYGIIRLVENAIERTQPSSPPLA